MVALILDTSNEKSFLMLTKEKEVLSLKLLQGGASLSSYIFDELSSFLSTTDSFDYVAVGIGPGSYTGIRVAASIAKSFSYAKNIPLLGFCSLYSFAPQEDTEFICLLDAKTGGAYAIQGCKKKQSLTFSEPFLLSDEKLKPFVQDKYIISPHPTPLQKKLPSLVIHESDIGDSHLASFLFEKSLTEDFSHWEKLPLLYLS